MMRYSTILFDFGDTLLHFRHGASNDVKDSYGLIYLTKFLKRYKDDIRWNQVRNEFFDPWREQTRKSKPEVVNVQMFHCLDQFLNHHGIELNGSEKMEAVSAFYTEYQDRMYYENDLKHTLQELKQMGMLLGVVLHSVVCEDIVKLCLKKVEVDEFFDFILVQSLIRYDLIKRGIKSDETLLIGDELIEDILPAKELGLRTIWLNCKNKKIDGAKVYPDYIVQKLSEIPQYLKTQMAMK